MYFMYYQLTLKDGSKHIVKSGGFAQGNVWVKLDEDWIDKDSDRIELVVPGRLVFMPDIQD